MKAKLNHELETFKPLTLEITLESQKEIDFLYATFNWIDFCEVMRKESGDSPYVIREALDSAKSADACSDILEKLRNMRH